MKKQLLEQILIKKKHKEEFALITNFLTGESFIFEKNKTINKNFEKYSDEINNYFNNKQNGIIENTDIFIDTYLRPIKVIIVGAVHITQFLLDYIKNLNFEIFIIDPRDYFASEKRFPNMNIINKWPIEAFEEIKTDSSTALIALTHDPKIDDPALKHALKNKFFYIGALGSKMIVNEKGEFSGSISGGCVESSVIDESLQLIKQNKPFKKIELKVSNENAWEVGLACGGEIIIYLEQIN